MEFKKLHDRALEVRELYQTLEIKKYGKSWTPEQIAEGLVGDVGDLIKLVQAKSGIRDIENVDQKLSHELADCMWCLIVLSLNTGLILKMSSSVQWTLSKIKFKRF